MVRHSVLTMAGAALYRAREAAAREEIPHSNIKRGVRGVMAGEKASSYIIARKARAMNYRLMPLLFESLNIGLGLSL